MTSSTRSPKWSAHPGTQVVGLGPEQVLVQHRGGSVVLRASVESVRVLFDLAEAEGIDGAARSLGPGAADAVDLLRAVGGGRERVESPRIGVLGNGTWSRVLAEQLTARLGYHVAHAPVLEGRLLETHEEHDDEMRRHFASNDIVVCAMENVPVSALAQLNRFALDGRAAVMFPFFDAGMARLSPVVRGSSSPCFLCERIRALGLSAGDPLLRPALSALTVSAASTATPTQRELLAFAVFDNVVRHAVDGTSFAPGTSVGVSPAGRVERFPVPPLPGCPDCARSSGARVDTEGPADPAPHRDDDDVAFRELRRRGAGEMGHAFGSFFDHLRRTRRIVAAWGADTSTRRAALCHSVYGNDAMEQPLFDDRRREDLIGIVGSSAERLIHLFSLVDRRLMWDGDCLAPRLRSAHDGAALDVSAEERAALGVIDLANSIEQAASPDGTPGIWVADAIARGRELGRERVPFARGEDPFTLDEERRARARYLAGITKQTREPSHAARLLEEAATTNRFVGEPLIVLAELAATLGDTPTARRAARRGVSRLLALGSAWDKRSTFGTWLSRAGVLLADEHEEVRSS